MIFHCAQLSHPPTHWHAETCHEPGRGPSNPLYISSREWARSPFTARIERAPFHRARSASKKGTWPLPPHPSEAARCASTEDHQPPSLPPPIPVAIYRTLCSRGWARRPYLIVFLRTSQPCRLIYPLDSFSDLQKKLCSATALSRPAICKYEAIRSNHS